MKKINFVNLHAHSGFSIFDGFGMPGEYMDYAFENGMNAHALTDHGNMNGFSYQILHAKKMKEAGKVLKPIYGVEAYFVPSVKEWKAAMDQKQFSKRAKKIDDDARRLNPEELATLNKRRHVVLLAQDKKGLKNLFQLVSKSHMGDNFYRKPRIDLDLIKKHNEGLVCTSACLGGLMNMEWWINEDKDRAIEQMAFWADRFKQIFGRRFFIELQWNDIEEQHLTNIINIEIAKKLELELISTADCHYPTPEDFQNRYLYNKLGWLNSYNNEEFVMPESAEEIGYHLYPKNGEQMMESFEKSSEKMGYKYDKDLVLKSITNAYKISEELIGNIEFDTKVRLPDFVVPENVDVNEHLREVAVAGLLSKNLDSKEYRERLEEELEVIESQDFSKYFLTSRAYIKEAKDITLIGPSRGSAGGSLVSYVLGITQLDPIKWGLQFSRFLTRGAKGYPDIDTDFGDNLAVHDHLIKKWGEQSVVSITNFNRLKFKSVLKDLSKLFGVSFEEVNAVTTVMEEEAKGPAMAAKGIKVGAYTLSGDELRTHSETLKAYLKKYPDVDKYIDTLQGQIRSVSRHAGGMLVSNNLIEEMPLIRSAALSKDKKEARKKQGLNGYILQTPWSEGQNVRHLEPLGFIKFDRLGLSTLLMFQSCIENILEKQNGQEASFDEVQKWYNKNMSPDVLDLDDQKVWKYVFQDGRWPGIFQFTESGAQELCKSVAPTNINELSAVTSLYRPGPLGAGADKDYLTYKNNPLRIRYEHKILEGILSKTYGMIVYQEQISAIASQLGGLTSDEGQFFRKLLTKKGTGKDGYLQTLEEKFLKGCELNGMSNLMANKLLEKLVYFAAYGFNEIHAIAYSIISYQCAWFFTYYSAEWLAAVLERVPEKQKVSAINATKSYGFAIKSPDVNQSSRKWKPIGDGSTIAQPLSAVKGIGAKAIEEIFEQRPLTMDKLLFGISKRKVNKKVLTSLFKSGALDDLIDLEVYSNFKHFYLAALETRPKTRKALEKKIKETKGCDDFDEQEYIQFKVESSGIYPVFYIVDPEMEDRLKEFNMKCLGEFDGTTDQLFWGIVKETELKRTKRGSLYNVVTMIDTTFKEIKINCWSWQETDVVHKNHVYFFRVDHAPKWGFSTRSFKKNFRMIK